jgi:hypothetical protein
MHVLLLYEIGLHNIVEYTLCNLFPEHIPSVIAGQEYM